MGVGIPAGVRRRAGEGRSAFSFSIFQSGRITDMTLSSPKMITWVIALILGLIGILANLVALPVVSATVGFWLLVIAFLLLLVASVVKGL